MAAPRDRERASLMDRVALALLSGISTLLLGGLLWLGAQLIAAQFALGGVPSFAWVLVAAGGMAALGFVLLENFVGNALGSLLRLVLNLFQAVGP